MTILRALRRRASSRAPGVGSAHASDRGATTVEFVLLLPVLVLLIAVVVAGARVWWARASVQQFASSAARQASISRSAADAVASARQLVKDDARASGLRCVAGAPTLSLDTSGFQVPVGQAAEVRAHVSCAVPLSDVTLPFVGGSLAVEADAVSTLDRYRARG